MGAYWEWITGSVRLIAARCFLGLLARIKGQGDYSTIPLFPLPLSKVAM